MSETVTVWQAGLYVDGWWGHYSTAQALVRAITELGWTEPETDWRDQLGGGSWAADGPGPILTLALHYLSAIGPAAEEGSRRWLEESLLAEQARALADSEGWDLEEDLSQILADELEQAEEWLDSQPQTPEGHYWGHSEYGGWGLWLAEGLRQCEGCGSVEDAGQWPDQTQSGLSVCCAGEEEWL